MSNNKLPLDTAKRYCFDTSAFSHLWIRHYPRGNFSKLADEVEELARRGIIISPESVLTELSREDKHGLGKWAMKNKRIFLRPNESQLEKLEEIVNKYPNFLEQDKTFDDADPFLIALALCEDCVVIHEEHASGFPKNPTARPKIPDICAIYGLDNCGVLEFIQRQKWIF